MCITKSAIRMHNRNQHLHQKFDTGLMISRKDPLLVLRVAATYKIPIAKQCMAYILITNTYKWRDFVHCLKLLMLTQEEEDYHHVTTPTKYHVQNTYLLYTTMLLFEQCFCCFSVPR